MIHPAFHICDTYMLKSLPGGPIQSWHRDYNDEKMKSVPNGFFPGTAIVSLQENTDVYIKKHKKKSKYEEGVNALHEG